MTECERFEEQLSALLDGELTAEEEAEARAHMAACPDCRAMYEAFAAVGDAIGGQDVPDTLHDGIMEKVRAAEKAGRTQHTIVRLRPVLAAAACLVVLVGTVFALRNNAGFRSKADKAASTEAAVPMAPAAGFSATGGSVPAEAAPEAAEDLGILESKVAEGAVNGGIMNFDSSVTEEEPREAPATGAANTEEAARADTEDWAYAVKNEAADVVVTAKIAAYESADAVIADSALIIRARKLDEEPAAEGEERFTLSAVLVEEVCRDSGASEIRSGNTVSVRESQWIDAESGSVYHLAGYTKMETGKDYLLLLGADETSDSYSPVGVLYGKIPLDAEETPFLGGAHEDILAIQNELRDTFCP